ncbi:MAG: RsbRD N-terminal domain-containing protein [Thermodesulfovibrionia bacterium]
MGKDMRDLNRLLTTKREAIIGKWFNLIIDSYPPDTADYLKNQKNPFSNPVGSTIHTAIEGILDELLNPSDSMRVSTYLDNIIRIRAIQDFTPSIALNFLFLLKDVVRIELNKEIYEYNLFEDLLMFESQVDRLLKESFDIYMRCREKIYELGANEIRNMAFQLLRNK